jgi:hypothetical protein
MTIEVQKADERKKKKHLKRAEKRVAIESNNLRHPASNECSSGDGWKVSQLNKSQQTCY